MLELVLIVSSSLACVAIAYLFCTKQWIFGDMTVVDDVFPVQLQTKAEHFASCTQIDAYEKALQALCNQHPKQPFHRKDTLAEASDARTNLATLLMLRAKADILAGTRWEAEAEMFWGMYRRGKLPKVQWERLASEIKGFKQAYEEEKKKVIDHASKLRPGRPGWGDSIFHEAYEELLREHQSKPGVDDMQGFEPSKLRFQRGDRVRCNMGDEHGWLPGTVKSAFGLPYQVLLDKGTAVTAPKDEDSIISKADDSDQGTPKELTHNLCMWRPLRFCGGDQVMCYMGAQGGFQVGVVLTPTLSFLFERNHFRQPDNEASAAKRPPHPPYFVQAKTAGLIQVPHDVPKLIRACTPEEQEVVTLSSD